MKKELILIILLIAVALFGCKTQKSNLTLLPNNLLIGASTALGCDSCKWIAAPYVRNENYTFQTPTHTKSYTFRDFERNYLEIFIPDSSGVIKVIVNRRRLEWVNDSTFIIRTK